MIIEVHDHLQKPLVFKATRLLVTFDNGTPAALILNFGHGHIRVFRADDKDFNEQLRMAGIDRTVVIDKFQSQKQNDGSNKLIRGKV